MMTVLLYSTDVCTTTIFSDSSDMPYYDYVILCFEEMPEFNITECYDLLTKG